MYFSGVFDDNSLAMAAHSFSYTTLKLNKLSLIDIKLFLFIFK